MSATAQAVTVLSPATGGRSRARPLQAGAPSRPGVRLAAFCALGLYGALRWSALITPAPVWRVLGLLALAAMTAGGLGALARRGRVGGAIAALGAAAIIVASLPLAGVPISLVLHAKVHVIVAGIGQGLAALPRVTVPYGGIDQWARVVVLLGAAVLMLDAAVLLAFAPSRLGDARRAAAALPLIALAVVPSTLMRPSLPYLHGLLLLALVSTLVWGERLQRRGLAAAVAVTAAAGGVALAAAPALDNHHAWINYQSIAGAFSPSRVETFDWTQRYGPLVWPRTGREMLDVQAGRGDYWKAENLDTFNGTRWVQGPVETGNLLPPPDPAATARWTQTLRVTIRGMQTTDIVAAGFAAQPQHVPAGALLGMSPGTWSSSVDLGPGDTYLVRAYSPRPSHAQLAAAGSPAAGELLAGYRSMVLPAPASTPYVQPEVVFPPFHSPAPAQSVTQTLANDGTALVESSPYARAYALAQGLARSSATQLAYVDRVQSYLAHGFTYGENPPQRQYPLESFLFADKLGYCQQFSGAMALLLRMGGVPARVAAGFTSGTYDAGSHQWVVTDLDAHAWVEVWFPRYGWVRFDPTPAAAPALNGRQSAAALAAVAGHRGGVVTQGKRRPEPTASATGKPARAPAGDSLPVAVVLLLLIACLAAVLMAARSGRVASTEELVAELERALARCGRPLAPGTTLAQLENRLRASPQAAGYVHALLIARYGGAGGEPTRAGRRALRDRLADGLGPLGRLRAVWALPPRMW